MKRAAKLRSEANEKREMADLVKRVGSGLSFAEGREIILHHALNLEAEATALEAQADALEARRERGSVS